MVRRDPSKLSLRVSVPVPGNKQRDVDFQQRKRLEILHCLRRPEVDLVHLRSLCLSRGGLLCPEIRQMAWKMLLGIDMDRLMSQCGDGDGYEDEDDREDGGSERKLECEDLVSIDVNRAVLFRYGRIREKQAQQKTSGSSSKTMPYSEMLKRLIISALKNLDRREFSYYQGFHDIASVVLINIPNTKIASSILSHIAQFYLRDAMMTDFSNISLLMNTIFYPLLNSVDPELCGHLSRDELQLQPTTFLPWMITLFSHDIHDSSIISRLFDAILASHPLFPLYVSIAMLTHERSREALFDPELEDPMILHVTATRLIPNLLNDSGEEEGHIVIQDIIDNAIKYM